MIKHYILSRVPRGLQNISDSWPKQLRGYGFDKSPQAFFVKCWGLVGQVFCVTFVATLATVYVPSHRQREREREREREAASFPGHSATAKIEDQRTNVPEHSNTEYLRFLDLTRKHNYGLGYILHIWVLGPSAADQWT